MRYLLLLLLLALAGCPPPKPPDPGPKEHPVQDKEDLLGTRPTLGKPIPFKAPEPVVYQTASGITVWLVERPALPVVSMTLALMVGAADDPLEKGGLAHITASMLDEGAGALGALEISDTLSDLGAEMWAGVDEDGSRISLTSLRKNLDAAFQVFADVIARPQFLPAEFDRVHKHWLGELSRRDDDVESVARVVRSAVAYGPDTPYGHPTSGLVSTASKIKLADVKKFYQDTWRPDQALLVVGGAITRAELDKLIEQHLGDWKKPAAAAAPRIAPPKPLAKRPRLVLVDRPDAPQAVITVVGDGIQAGDMTSPQLDLINTALGGSFTSRLNQNLREDHGWTYGARSAFLEMRGIGIFLAKAAVHTQVTGVALQETLSEIDKMAKSGLTPDELRKVRARDLTDMMETNETLDSLVGRLSSLGILSLKPDHDAKSSAARQNATKDELDALGRRFLDTSKMSIIIVGPRDQVLPQLKALNLGDPEMWTVEGRPAVPAKK